MRQLLLFVLVVGALGVKSAPAAPIIIIARPAPVMVRPSVRPATPAPAARSVAPAPKPSVNPVLDSPTGKVQPYAGFNPPVIVPMVRPSASAPEKRK